MCGESGRGAECPGSDSVSRSTWPKHRPPQLRRAPPAWSELHAVPFSLESWASAQSSDPSQAGVGIPSTSPWCPWAPRCQLCGQLNGSSVPFWAPHPAPGSPGPPLWVGVPREDAHRAGSQEQEQQETPVGKPGRMGTCPGHRGPLSEARSVSPVAFRSHEEAKLLSGGSCPCRLLTPLPYHDLFCIWALYPTLMYSLWYTASITGPDTQCVLSAHFLEAQKTSFSLESIFWSHTDSRIPNSSEL